MGICELCSLSAIVILQSSSNKERFTPAQDTYIHSIQLFHTRGAVDDPLQFCLRHPQHRGGDNLTVAQKGLKEMFYYPMRTLRN